jgi:hypothetical protein
LKPPCKAFLIGACAHCSKLAIDDYSFLYTNHSESAAERGSGWHAVPFPSDFHWSRAVARPFPWESEQARDILVSYVGSSWSTYNPAKRLPYRLTILYFMTD